ncbi:MAG TPA: aminotransferase class V-fold PLP-dependent enzyme [Bacteroidales bacterium]|nr:aminotransferase class V-fold PLP-dependent enzyme [Bacteroidales bacterium]
MKIYLDNSATSWPKPASIISAMTSYLNDYGGSPGRSGHQFAAKAAQEVFETRELIASLFNCPAAERVMFSANATHALNFAIKGILNPGDHVIISHMEHNAVYRTVSFLKNEGIISFDIANCNERGFLDIGHLKSLIRSNTRMIICIHGSNVSGTIQNISEIGSICAEQNILFLVDAAQSAGFVPIDMVEDNIDLLAFTGHKKLYGPTGIGGLCIKDEIAVRTHIHGGTGSKSEMADHPLFYPDRLEAGTLNAVGIIGLKAGIQHVLDKGINTIRKSLSELTRCFINECNQIDGISIYGPSPSEERLPLVSMNIRNLAPADIASALDKDYGIMVRPGLHCSPLAHQTIGTFPGGTLRFSFGCFSTEEEVKYSIDALKKIAHKH